jgi:hypothetical protein
VRGITKYAILLLGLLCTSANADAVVDVGVITEIQGDVQLIRPSGVFAAAAGVALQGEDVIRTADNASAQLEMLDGSVFELGPQSELYLAEYQLDRTDSVAKAEIGILNGWLRFLTGRLSREAQYEYVTPTVTIGIRGTEGVIAAAEHETELLLSDGQVDVAELDNDGRSGMVTALRAGEFLSRRQGQRTQKFRQPSERFERRRPARFRRQFERRLANLRGRRALPRKLREANYHDVEGLLHSNPRLRQKFERRFEKRLQNPEFRAKAKGPLKDHPQSDRELNGSAPEHRRPTPERPARPPRPQKKDKNKGH